MEGVDLELEGAVDRVGMGAEVLVVVPLAPEDFSGVFDLELLFAPDASFERERPGRTTSLTLLHGDLGGDADARIANLDLTPPVLTGRPTIAADTVLGENNRMLVLTIVFNEDIDPLSVTADDFTLTDIRRREPPLRCLVSRLWVRRCL